MEHSGAIKPSDLFIDSGVLTVPFEEDGHGRPVVLIRLRNLISDSMPLEVLESGFCATMDAIISHLLSKRAAGTDHPANPLDQYMALVDVRDASAKNFSLEHVKLIK